MTRARARHKTRRFIPAPAERLLPLHEHFGETSVPRAAASTGRCTPPPSVGERSAEAEQRTTGTGLTGWTVTWAQTVSSESAYVKQRGGGGGDGGGATGGRSPLTQSIGSLFTPETTLMHTGHFDELEGDRVWIRRPDSCCSVEINLMGFPLAAVSILWKYNSRNNSLYIYMGSMLFYYILSLKFPDSHVSKNWLHPFTDN